MGNTNLMLWRASGLLGLLACAAAPVEKKTYRSAALATASPFAEGRCGLATDTFRPVDFLRKGRAHLPMWAEHAISRQSSDRTLHFHFDNPPDFNEYLITEFYELQMAFDRQISDSLDSLRATHQKNAGGKGAGDSVTRLYHLHADVIAFQPPQEDPPVGMRMTLRLAVQDEKGLSPENVEIDLETADADFRGAGQQLAAKYSRYISERLGCWLSWP